MKKAFFYEYPFVGSIGIAEKGGALTRVFFGGESVLTGGSVARAFFGGENALTGFDIAETPLIKETAERLSAYFSGKTTSFDLPLAPRGTAFQLSVWNALRTIPAGETRSYKDVATMIENPRAYRAVGMANNRNPIAIIVPCHRVIGHNGNLTGYAGGLHIKQYLLDMEKHMKNA